MERFNFSLCQISLMDHRRLVDLLLAHNPEKYVPLKQPEQPYDFLRETQEFLRELYQMSERDYRRELDEQVIKYYQYWWGGPERIDPMIDPAVKFY